MSVPLASRKEPFHQVESYDLMLVAGSSFEAMPSADIQTHAPGNEAHLIIANPSPSYLDRCAGILINAYIANIIPQSAPELLNG